MVQVHCIDGRVFVRTEDLCCSVLAGLAAKADTLFSEYAEVEPFEFVNFWQSSEPRFVIELRNEDTKCAINDLETLKRQIFSNDQRSRVLLALYCDLRRRGWQIRRGTNFGADFLLYESDPNKVHSRYAVFLLQEMGLFTWSRLSGLNRVCVSARKSMIVAIERTEDGNAAPDALHFDYLRLKRWVPESGRE